MAISRPAVAVREEAGIASDRVLQAADPGEHFASRVAAIGPSGQLGGRIELELKTVLVEFRDGDQAAGRAPPRPPASPSCELFSLCSNHDHDPGASVLVLRHGPDGLSLGRSDTVNRTGSSPAPSPRRRFGDSRGEICTANM